jgi:hypothetical protein
MGSPAETTEEDFQERADLPSWALELGEKPVPLREAARLAGISLATAKRRIAERPALVLCRKGGERGRPAPFVLPSSLLPKEKAPDAKASSYFAHRCRLAGVNPPQTLWRIVTGCLPDADKIIDAMRYAMDEEVEQGTPLFLKWVGGGQPLPGGEPRSFHHWLARSILRKCSRKVPRGTVEELWKKALRKVERDGRLFRHLILQGYAEGAWKLAESPDYWRNLKRVPGYAGESRLLERSAHKRKAAQALGELLLRHGSGSRVVEIFAASQERMRKAKRMPRFPAFSQAPGRGLEEAGALSREERERLGVDFLGSVGSAASLGADTRAEEALAGLMMLGISRTHARAYLRAYWQRIKHPLKSKLSPSAVRLIFGITTRARTRKSPERRRKTHTPASKKNVYRSRLLSETPSRKSAR